jgi:hypothetical protein
MNAAQWSASCSFRQTAFEDRASRAHDCHTLRSNPMPILLAYSLERAQPFHSLRSRAKIMKAKIMKGKLAILAMTGVLAVTLSACNGYYAYDYRSDYKGGPAYGYASGYYPHMYDWYSQPLYGRGYWGGYGYPYRGLSRP